MNKHLEFTTVFKAVSQDENDDLIITGLANAAVEDRVGDIIPEEAYKKGGLDNYRKNPILLFNHDYGEPIGKTTGIEVSASGLAITATISEAAGRIYKLIKDGVLKSFSIGFMVTDASYDSATDIFVIKDLELLEVSVVSVPANQDSIFDIAKQFDTEKDYTEFKQSFQKENNSALTDSAIQKEVDEVNTDDTSNISAIAQKEDIYMTEAEIKALEEKLKKAQSELSTTKGNLEAAEDLLDDVAKDKAVADAVKAKDDARIEVKSQVEDLIKEVESRFTDNNNTLQESIKGLETELKEKADEIKSLTTNKMNFADGRSDTLTREEKNDAVLVSKLLGKDIRDTKFFQGLVTKSGVQHTPSADWEVEFNTNIFEEMKEKLVLEPLFKTLQMSTASMQIPLNPEAGDATWVSSNAVPSLNQPSSDGSSTGNAVLHKLGETTLTAYKLASKEYLGYEEEEDAILGLVPIIRDAITRRMSRTSDQSLLRGTGAGAGGSAISPFKGLTTLAADGRTAHTITKHEVAVAAQYTVDDLQAVRRQLGSYGLNPGEVKYIVSEAVYYDLLEDPDFRTMDLVGNKATIITGQIGSVNGSPVIVSDSFEPKAATKDAVVAVYTPNFFVGNLRTMMIERDTDIINQKRVIVATRRMGFLAMSNNYGVACGGWKV